MTFQEGYVYHISDSYFSKVQDDKLMQNKEGGTYRPTFLCLKDRKHQGLLWVVPMSTRVNKYRAIQKKQITKYGKCLTIVIGEFDGRQAAFLLQNMFPITEKYLDHIHTRNGNPVPVKHSIAQKVQANMTQLRQLIYKGYNVVFPDIRRLESLMIAELQQEKVAAVSKVKPSVLKKVNYYNQKIAAKDAAKAAATKAAPKGPTKARLGKDDPGGR